MLGGGFVVFGVFGRCLLYGGGFLWLGGGFFWGVFFFGVRGVILEGGWGVCLRIFFVYVLGGVVCFGIGYWLVFCGWCWGGFVCDVRVVPTLLGGILLLGVFGKVCGVFDEGLGNDEEVLEMLGF